MEENARVWLISGCSSGMGREIALAALRKGYRVVVTARNTDTVQDLVQAFPRQALALALDVTRPEQIADVVARSHAHFGRIDVLVNNAGYGYLAAIEEGEEQEIRAMFETNFFGLVALTRAVLPEMRTRRSGHIINHSSQAGLMSMPGTGYYSTTKFAVEAFSEALHREMAPFGVHVTAVEPGPFRTDWSGRSMKRTRTPIADYAETVGARCDLIQQMDGRQPGDPQRAAEAFVMLTENEHPPMRLLLGRIVLDSCRARLAETTALLDCWEETTLAADFPPD